jgi:hypothetical protein
MNRRRRFISLFFGTEIINSIEFQLVNVSTRGLAIAISHEGVHILRLDSGENK